MKRVKIFIILICLFLICGCSSKFEGTWCKYSDVATSLVILKNDINDNEINKITDYIKTIDNLKSYDIIDKIEEASKMITIYYKNEDNISSYEDKIKSFNGVDSIKSTKVNEVVDKLIIKKKEYIYDKSLNNLSATEDKGSYTIDNNTLILDNNTKFYYKNKYLCYDEMCNLVMTKSKTNDCG